MQATFWLLTDEGPWTPHNQPSVHHVLGHAPVRTQGLQKPPDVIKKVVQIPIHLDEFTDPIGISKDICVAQYQLFHMEGMYPNEIAHYQLINRPPTGWMWIVHPAKKAVLILCRSLSPYQEV